MTWTVGFDLDMTLIDSRPGVRKAIEQLATEFGLPLHCAELADRLGPPLAMLLSDAGAPEELIPALVTRYRQIYPSIVPYISAMPGADAALAAVRARGGRVLIVTGKYEPLARLHVAELGWRIDEVIGGLWSDGKAAALREHAADLFVGDHEGDMRGARAAGVYALGVATGPCNADQLHTAGADFVLGELTEFEDWLATR
ncbi:HAD hydrolase-like protein [Nocardia sp. NPDC049707]|uniref:HAD family hydrolase n=1 Tax=Nocardia sp. NPDC049707 TaxID=3154735 RepID=UPI00341BA1AE